MGGYGESGEVSQYLIVASSDCIWLAEEVERKIADGWSCQGGVSVSIAAYTYDGRKGETVEQVERYAQALVR